MRRRLVVRREALAPLGTGDLAAVVAADALPTVPVGVCAGDVLNPIAERSFRYVECDSLLRPCVSSTCGGA